jgi:peptidoglycan hydrolase-like protein with peptidoglycan-binding domain
MSCKYFISAALAATLFLGTTAPVRANGGDFLAGAVLGGILGSANKQKTRRTTTTYRSRLPSTQEGKEIQASLNYFGFPAGRVDGQLGQKTRNAVSSYQAYLGYPVSGQLSPFEQELLISSYNRAQAGGYQTTQLVASSPEGTRSLLKTFRSEMAGGNGGQGATTLAVQAPVPVAAAAPEVMPSFAASGQDSMPSFLGGSAEVSLASHCNKVSLLTNSNGGFVTEASMVDADQALNEQFCLARTYAVSHGEDMISKVQGFTPDQIAQQCEGLAPPMSDQVAALSIKPREAVLADTSNFVLTSGMSPAQLGGTAKICLSVGYRTDNMEVALASALLLVALGERPYGELLGHHLSQGVGAARRPDLAQAWYADSLNALASGSTAVFAPGQTERIGLLFKASTSLNGSALAAPSAVVPTSSAVLPAFSIAE